MNQETMSARWAELHDEVRAKWADLTTEDIDAVQGDLRTLIARIEARYGWSHERAEQEVGDWMKICNIPEPRTVEV